MGNKVGKLYRKLQHLRKEHVYQKGLKDGSIFEARIVKPEDMGIKVAIYKEQTDEEFVLPKVHGFLKESRFVIDYPEIALWRFEDASVFYGSDMVLSKDNRVIWPKYFKYNYNKNITRDNFACPMPNGQMEHEGFLNMRTATNIVECDTIFSMIGVFDYIWAHALVEYYPKLEMLQKAIDDSCNRVTVILPDYKDAQLCELVYGYLKKYDVDILVVKPNESVHAKRVYYMERPTVFTDHETNVALGDQAIPVEVAKFLRENLVLPYTKNLSIDSKYKKVFLARRGGIGKGIINGSEIEVFFERRGFVFVEPHKVSLEDKVRIFQSAEVLVGPLGSAFTNLFMCRPGTKVLMFTNYQRVFENYISMPIQHFGIDVMYLFGYDDKLDNPAHCSYRISLDVVKNVVNEFGIA